MRNVMRRWTGWSKRQWNRLLGDHGITEYPEMEWTHRDHRVHWDNKNSAGAGCEWPPLSWPRFYGASETSRGPFQPELCYKLRLTDGMRPTGQTNKIGVANKISCSWPSKRQGERDLHLNQCHVMVWFSREKTQLENKCIYLIFIS